MNRPEANTIAILRSHFGCSFGKLANLAIAIWGIEKAQKIAGKVVTGQQLGIALLVAMEKTLGLELAESEEMSVDELICLECKHTHYALCHPADTAKECPECGGMSCFPSTSLKPKPKQ